MVEETEMKETLDGEDNMKIDIEKIIKQHNNESKDIKNIAESLINKDIDSENYSYFYKLNPIIVLYIVDGKINIISKIIDLNNFYTRYLNNSSISNLPNNLINLFDDIDKIDDIVQFKLEYTEDEFLFFNLILSKLIYNFKKENDNIITIYFNQDVTNELIENEIIKYNEIIKNVHENLNEFKICNTIFPKLCEKFLRNELNKDLDIEKKNNIMVLKLSNNTNIFNLNVINVIMNNSTISKTLKIKEDMTLSNIYKFIINSIQAESIYSIEFKVKTNNQIESTYVFQNSVPIFNNSYNKLSFFQYLKVEDNISDKYQRSSSPHVSATSVKSLNPDLHREFLENNPCSNYILEIYEMLEHYCEIKKQTHWMSAKHYEGMERIFIIPSILISTASGIASFVASTELPGDNGQIWLSLSVGVMASISTLLQSFSNAYGYQAKSECHQNAAESYDQIITSLRFEKINPQDGCNSAEFIKSIQTQISETKQRCKYIVPEWIDKQFENNEFNNLTSQKKRDIYKKLIKLKSKKYLEHITSKQYDEIDFQKINETLGFVEFNEINKKNYCW